MILSSGYCSHEQPRITERDLVGDYRLNLGAAYEGLPKPEDKLLLRAGGTYSHRFRSVTGVERSSSGHWAVIRGSVLLRDWIDYAGITSLQPKGERTLDYTALLEGTPPVIVLEGDANIFYSRR
jgi:hypothetical protein